MSIKTRETRRIGADPAVRWAARRSHRERAWNLETKRAHPTASKSEIVRAAFASMIALADRDPDIALMLQSFALAERRKPEVND